MDHRSTGHSALLVDRPSGDPTLPAVDLATGHPHLLPSVPEPVQPGDRRSPPLFESPGLAVLAVSLVLEGYSWLGVIPTRDSRLLSPILGRPGAAAFAAVFVIASTALIRPDGHVIRTPVQKLVIGGACAVVAASCVLFVSGGPLAATVLGAVDLIAAACVAAAFAVNEWGSKNPDNAHRTEASVPGTSATSGLVMSGRRSAGSGTKPVCTHRGGAVLTALSSGAAGGSVSPGTRRHEG